jgi:hypothetical protein
MPFFIGFAAGALMGTACLYYTLLRRPAPPPAPPKVKTRLTHRERTIEL